MAFAAAAEPIDTITSTGKLLLGVSAVVAAFDEGQIVESTREGMARARSQRKRLVRAPGSKDKKKRSRRGYLFRWFE